MTTDFSKARVGDKVFDRFRQEWGVIDGIYKEYDHAIEVDFLGDMEEYLIDGRLEKEHHVPALVWGKQTATEWCGGVLPEMPRRIVKSKINGYLNIYPDGLHKFHLSKEAADYGAASDRITCLTVSGEYEIEED